jgi:hypothetical protein
MYWSCVVLLTACPSNCNTCSSTSVCTSTGCKTGYYITASNTCASTFVSSLFSNMLFFSFSHLEAFALSQCIVNCDSCVVSRMYDQLWRMYGRNCINYVWYMFGWLLLWWHEMHLWVAVISRLFSLLITTWNCVHLALCALKSNHCCYCCNVCSVWCGL